MDKTSTRFAFSVPKGDTQILKWIEAQYNLSSSIRMLIKDYIARNGIDDVSCRSLTFTDNVVTISAPRSEPSTGTGTEIEKQQLITENIETKISKEEDIAANMLADMLK